jgi:ferritin
MKIIKKLASLINEEIADADKYAELAMSYRESCPEAADVFYQLSTEEMTHMQRLHNVAAGIISRYDGEVTPKIEAMKLAYEVLHEQYIERAREVKALQAMYRGE